MRGHSVLPIPVQARPWNLLAEVPAIFEKRWKTFERIVKMWVGELLK